MLNLTNIVLIVGLLMTIFFLFWFVTKRIQIKKIHVVTSIFILGFISLLLPVDTFVSNKEGNEDEFVTNAKRSKWGYFVSSSFSNYLHSNSALESLLYKGDMSASVVNSDYPFLRNDDTKDFLGSYLNRSEQVPNLVVIIVEGLGAAYSTSNGYVGSFTPFLDSLRQKSLYWSNNLSSSGRTFSVLPTVLGSLPFATNGFLEQDKLPNHFNLYNVLGHNGFETGFYYGGDAQFDHMRSLLDISQVDNIVDQESYSTAFQKLPSNSGESWGYEDQALFTNYLQNQSISKRPYFNVIMTLSTHNPFLINRKEFYEHMFDKHLLKPGLSAENKRWANENRKQLVSVLNFDDALSQFFMAYAQRADFENTIFVITGDHAMPEIPLQTKIDRYHVPLLIYSPLLKQERTFKNTVSHFDLAPSLLAYYRNNYKIATPRQVTWLGDGLDEGISSKSNGIAMMQSKNQLIDFVYGNYHLVDDNLYRFDAKMNETLIDDNSAKEVVKHRFDKFKEMNRSFVKQQKLMPDSVYQSFINDVIRKP